MRTSVLVVAEEAALRAAVARALLPIGYRVEIASDEKRARQLIGNDRFAAAIVAPVGCKGAFLREVQGAVGNLVVLAEGASAEKRLATSFPDALVFAAQSLEPAKLTAFLRSLNLAKAPVPETASASELLHFHGCTLDVPGRMFLDANLEEAALTRGEFALLVAFARNPGRVLSRAQLRNAIDGGSADAYDRSIDMLITRLRRKIGPDPPKPPFIVTVPGVGYKFAARVHSGEPAIVSQPDSPCQSSAKGEAQHAERRQLTVLACQILGFAALAAELDPEDLEKVIRPAYARCAEVIARFNGTMVRAAGDSLLAYFGHPKSDENDAESAVRAALELLRVIGNIEAAPIERFRAQVGIATGLMVIGELSSVGTKEPIAMGEALNLALHMQKSAPAGNVVIASGTRELIGRFFHCREFEPVVVEEGHEPAPAWRVVDETSSIDRFEALRRDEMLDLVGREGELDRLLQCWSRAAGGAGQVVLLTGEAGIGKSRLVSELKVRLQAEPHAEVRYFGSPHRTDAPMTVVLDELQSAAGIVRTDDAPLRLAKIAGLLAAFGPTAKEAAALVAGLLGLACEAPAEINQLSPQKRKERTFAALMARVDSMTSRQPLLAILEDVQWVDPTSLEFVTMLVERAATLRLLLVIVGRPEFVPPWPAHSYVSSLALSRLSRAASEAMIHQVAGARRVPPAIETEIVARADGVPLFVEELTKSLLDRRTKDDGATLRVKGSIAPTIPTTLHGLLLARIDQLECGREVAQAGAVIGREFSYELLRMTVSMEEPLLGHALDQLVTSGLVFRRGSVPHAFFIFKHALVRDAAYGMLPRQRRQQLHTRVARSYEEQFPETAKAQPELLAYHYREAGHPAKAIGYLLVAAERALLGSATTGALSLLVQTRELISKLPENRRRSQLELGLEITLARALLAARGYTAPETREAYRRARECCEVLGDQSSLPQIIHGQWLGAWIAADHKSALEEARRMLLWGERNNDPVGLAVGHADLGMTLTTLGRIVEARRHLEQALQINNFAVPGRQPFVASDVDGRISALSFMHYCLLLLGFPEQAGAMASEAAKHNPRNLYSRTLAQIRMLRTRVLVRDAPGAAALGLEVMRLAQEQGYPHILGTAMVYTGWALAQRGEVANGIDSCERGLAQLQGIGGKCWFPLMLALLAECHQLAGDRERTAAALARALESVEATDERFWEAEIFRLKGNLHIDADDAGAAAICFETALHKARAQQAKLLELRTAVSLADLFKRERKPAQACKALAPIYDSFTEGFDFIDLREAKALLDSLADRSETSSKPRQTKQTRSAPR